MEGCVELYVLGNSYANELLGMGFVAKGDNDIEDSVLLFLESLGAIRLMDSGIWEDSGKYSDICFSVHYVYAGNICLPFYKCSFDFFRVKLAEASSG